MEALKSRPHTKQTNTSNRRVFTSARSTPSPDTRILRRVLNAISAPIVRARYARENVWIVSSRRLYKPPGSARGGTNSIAATGRRNARKCDTAMMSNSVTTAGDESLRSTYEGSTVNPDAKKVHAHTHQPTRKHDADSRASVTAVTAVQISGLTARWKARGARPTRG